MVEIFAAVIAIADLFEQAAIDSFEIVVTIVTVVEEAILWPEAGLPVAELYEAVALVAALIVVLAVASAAVEDN